MFERICMIIGAIALATPAAALVATQPTQFDHRVGAKHPLPRISWKNQPLRAMPLVQNFVVATNLVGSQHYNESGFIGLSPITAAPFTGNFQNSTIRFNNTVHRVTDVTWGVCHAHRESDKIQNVVSMPFARHMIFQKWTLDQDLVQGPTSVQLFLDGPYARACDSVGRNGKGSYSNECGWFTMLPEGRKNDTFTRRLNPMVHIPGLGPHLTEIVTEDRLTLAATASYLFLTDSTGKTTTECPGGEGVHVRLGPNSTWDHRNFGYGFFADLTFNPSCTLWHVMAFNQTAHQAANDLKAVLAKNPLTQFHKGCADWQAHFDSAFERDNQGNFSGNLPTLETTDSSIRSVYEWSLVAMVSLERLGYKAFPRQFVISDGPSETYRGNAVEGGSGQFVWDLSFAATSSTLLDPAWARQELSHIVSNAGFNATFGGRVKLAQAWDGYTYETPVGPGIYCFDYIATYLFLQTYVTNSGDTAFLTKVIPQVNTSLPSGSPLKLMRQIAWAWRSYPRSVESPYLVDYGSNKRDFLEAAGAYTDVIPALQGANAGMMLSLANLLEVLDSQGGHHQDEESYAEEVAHLRGNATAIVDAMVKHQFVDLESGDGAWKCLTDNVTLTPKVVRCICDTVYIPLAQMLASDNHANSSLLFHLPPHVRQGMVAMFNNELKANGWIRAISLEDESMKGTYCHMGNCSVNDLVSMRADWTAVGAYGGTAGAAVDAMAQLGSFDSAIDLLRNLSLVTHPTRGTQPAQGIAVMTTPFFYEMLDHNYGIPVPEQAFDPAYPEFFSSAGWGGPWPRTERSVQNAEAAISDAVVRSIFGWRPTWRTVMVSQQNTTAVSEAISNSLWMPSVARQNFTGTLRNVRTPFDHPNRYIDIALGAEGLSWSFSRAV